MSDELAQIDTDVQAGTAQDAKVDTDVQAVAAQLATSDEHFRAYLIGSSVPAAGWLPTLYAQMQLQTALLQKLVNALAPKADQ